MNIISKDSSGFANAFASEFNKADIHDRVLCFEVIKEGELEFDSDDFEIGFEVMKGELDSEDKDDDLGETGSVLIVYI